MFGHSFLHTTHLSIVLGSGVVTVLTYLLIQFLLRLLDWCLISKASTAPPRGYVGEHPKAKDIRDKWKERSIRTVDVPAAACHAAAVLQSTGRRADAEECFQVAQEAWQYERHLLSEMRCNEFVGKDGKGSHHLGTFSDTHYRLNSLRTREDSRTQMYDPQRQWQQLVQTLQRSRWRIAVYLLRLSQQKVMREERERQKWDQEQRAKREKDREQRVDEWIACEKRRWRQARPDICGRYHAHDKW